MFDPLAGAYTEVQATEPAVVQNVPVSAGKVRVKSAPGSVTAIVISLVSLVEPSNTKAFAPWIAAPTVKLSVIALPIVVLPFRSTFAPATKLPLNVLSPAKV